MPADPTQSLANLRLERDAILLYDALAGIEKDPPRAGGVPAGSPRTSAATPRSGRRSCARPASRSRRRRRGRGRASRSIILLARLFGTKAVSDLVTALEGDEEEIYEARQATPEVEAIAADEREHAEIWRKLKDPDYHPDRRHRRPASAGTARAAPGRSGRSSSGSATGSSRTSPSSWASPARRADATPGHFILLAGIAGLLAGAFSMAAGEYISMQSQRELFERQIALERAEMEAMPEEEEAEMAALYRAKGFREDEAKAIAHRLFEDPERALDQLIREELGLDPDELGSPLGAACGSFVAFALGAFVPVAAVPASGSGGRARSSRRSR